ncbi:MAG: ANTAR domain-containing response regulator [Christensenellales bacterium]
MPGVLLVSSSEKGRDGLAALLREASITQIHMAGSGSQARRFLIQGQASVVVINTPLSDEFGESFALFATEQTSASVIMLVKNEQADEVAHQVENEGILVVEKPMSKALFFQAVKLSLAAQRRMMGLQSENDRLQKKIMEIRLVDRAKCLLIENRGMTETEAHRYVEKQAMDLRITRREVAERILEQAEAVR